MDFNRFERFTIFRLPHPGCGMRYSKGEKMTKVCITIDTEGDSADNPYSTFFGINLILPKLLDLFSKYKIKATFFIQEDNICQIGSKFPVLLDTLQNLGHEIGYHAHGLIRSSVHQKEKIITTGIQNLRKLDFDPISFRAGRFHFNTEILRILEKNNVRYDSSVVPGLQERFKDGKERCNHVGAPYYSYFPSYENHCKEGRSKILELPINRYPTLPFNQGGYLTGKHDNQEILFDYFYEIRKDRLIIIILHSWDGLSGFSRRLLRNENYKKTTRFAFESFAILLHNFNHLVNRRYIENFDSMLKYISRKNDIHFQTIEEAAKSINLT
jgi:peptidoglycan/xylan/chitin deacetylase (PgdA/CDA1 family)